MPRSLRTGARRTSRGLLRAESNSQGGVAAAPLQSVRRSRHDTGMTEPLEDHLPGELTGAPGGDDNAANVDGAAPALPDTGFGQRWEKRISVRIERGPGAEPLMSLVKRQLPALWPARGNFYRPWHGLREGEVAGVDISVGPVTLSTGVVVAESTATRLTLVAPQGHMFAGWNRISTRDEGDTTVVELHIEMRASDPLFEAGLMLGGHRNEERFWAEFLWNIAALYGQRPAVRLQRRRLSRERQWSRWTNARHNVVIRTAGRRVIRVLRKGRQP